MPQYNHFQAFKSSLTGLSAQAVVDANTGTVLASSGGGSVSLNVTSTGTIKSSPGRISKIIVQNAGSAGTLTVNDCASTGAASAGNTLFKIGQANISAGQTIDLDLPLAVGLTVSAIPTGATLLVSYT